MALWDGHAGERAAPRTTARRPPWCPAVGVFNPDSLHFPVRACGGSTRESRLFMAIERLKGTQAPLARSEVGQTAIRGH